MEIKDLTLLDLHPSQFYVSEEKIKEVQTWFDPENLSNFEPLPVKILNGRVILTDGHTRGWVAYCAGLTQVPLRWDEDEMDWDAYQRCVDACEARGVYTVADFQGRVLFGENYADKWLKWCEEMRHALEAERRMAREHETAFEK